MTSMEQIELISVEASKIGMKYGEYVKKYGHTLPKPEPKKHKESGYMEGKATGHRVRTENVCQMCGCVFLAGKKNAKYCEVCTKKRASESMKRYNKRKKGIE